MRGQQSYKTKAIIGMCFLIGMQFFAATSLAVADTPAATGSQAQPAPCQTLATNDAYFFDNYETHDYTGGFLALHFRLKQPYNDGRQWTDYGFNIYDQACKIEFHDAPNPRVSIDPGVQLYSIRFSSPTHYDFWDDETDVREQCAQCSGDLSTVFSTTGEQASTVSFFARIDGYGSWIQSDSLPIVAPPPAKAPVLFIPGILGTELSYAGQALWPNLVLSAVSDDGFMDPLQMDASGHAISTITVGGVIRSVNYAVGTFDYADGLASALAQQGYVEGSTLFFFPYDWRTDPADNLAALKTELDTIAALNPNSPKIDIVAHSYGGLLLKRYIQQTSDTRIGKIIFVGVPQLGSAEAAQALIFGSDLGVPILNSQEVFKLAQNMPMIYDLLPSAEYYKHAAGFFDDLSNITSPQIPGYDSDQSLLSTMGKNIRLLNQAALSHTDSLDNMDFGTLPYQVSSIVGCGVFTEKTINKMYNGDPTILERAAEGPKYRIEGDSGDGTVIMQSAVHDGGTVYYASGIPHAQLLSSPTTAAAIASILSGSVPDPASIHTADTVGTACDVSGKILSFSSDVNVVLKNRTTGAVLVPQQDYNVIQTGNDRHVFIPNDELPSYSVQVQDEVPGGTPENISITNSSSNSGDNHNTYNYNNQKLDTNLLAITFPAAASSDAGSGQDVENVDPTTGDVTDVPPSSQLDGSYNDIPGTSTTPPSTTSTSTPDTGSEDSNDPQPTASVVPSTATVAPDDSTPATEVQPANEDDGAGDAPDMPDPSASADDSASGSAQALNAAAEPGSADADTVQTKTLHTADGESITITINNMQPTPAGGSRKEDSGDAAAQPQTSGIAECMHVIHDISKVLSDILF